MAVADRLAEAGRHVGHARPARTWRPPARTIAVEDSGGSGSDTGGWVAVVLVIAAGVGAAVFCLTRSRRRLARRFDERRAAMQPLVDALANEVDELWQQISEGVERADAAYGAWDEAAQAQLAAREKLRRAASEADLSGARLQIEVGLRAAQQARAALDGRPAPGADAALLAGLCAFDPSHGQAVDAVPVTTAKGATADVPACADCASSWPGVAHPRCAGSRAAAGRCPTGRARAGTGAG